MVTNLGYLILDIGDGMIHLLLEAGAHATRNKYTP